MTRAFITAFVVGFVITACSQHSPRAMERLERRCDPVLTEILQVQDLRVLNNQMIHDKKTQHTLTVADIESWKIIENTLGERAAELYEIADKRRCFRTFEG